MLRLAVFKVLASSFGERWWEILLCCWHPFECDLGVVLYIVCHVLRMFIDAWISQFLIAFVCGEMVRALVWFVVIGLVC